MPLAFSFFGSKKAALAADSEDLSSEQAPEKMPEFQPTGLPAPRPAQSPFPLKIEEIPLSLDSLPPFPPLLPVADEVEPGPTMILPTPGLETSAPGIVLPERKNSPKGLAALVLKQSETEAPPLNRRSPGSPFPASPFPVSPFMLPRADVAEPTLNAPESMTSLLEKPAAAPPPRVPTQPVLTELAAHAHSPDEQLHSEIEQVKNDLFGAVMGVSALKDRLDGIEGQLTQIQQSAPAAAPQRAAPSAAEIAPLVRAWLDEHLTAAVERTLGTVQERMLSDLSTASYFRGRPALSQEERRSLFSHPPVILTTHTV